jgi:hypothetical protein
MPVSTLAVSASNTEENADSSCQAGGPILVLDPVGPIAGITPIVLYRARQFIGQDAECSIRLPDLETSSRHALILRGKRQFILKTFDQRTWLNGLPVRDSQLHVGDLLRVGENEFRVREATAHELLQSLPLAAPSHGAAEPSAEYGRLALRRARLSSLKTRLKECNRQIRCEYERLHADRALDESMSNARRQRTLRDIRASVSSLREVANSSARTAVASYATRKVRGLTTSIVTLSTIALLFVAVLVVVGNIESQSFQLAFGALMADFLILIKLSQKVRSIKNSGLSRVRPARENDRNNREATDGLGGPYPTASVSG